MEGKISCLRKRNNSRADKERLLFKIGHELNLEFSIYNIVTLDRLNDFFAACSVGFYGYKCKKKCECKFPNMDKDCDYRNGECNCEPGFISEYCNQSMSDLLL